MNPALALPRACEGQLASAAFKLSPADFRVEEVLGFVPDGEGEHLFLWVEKTGLNTIEALRRLARHYGLPPRDIGYAGLKDRQGVTRQWFSLRWGLKAEPPDPPAPTAEFQVLDAARNSRKLRRGSHRGNAFRIVLHPLAGEDGLALSETRLGQIRREGVPHYFGPQRFGRYGENVGRAQAMFEGTKPVRDRYLRGLYISAARAWLFNALLARRVREGTWNRYLDGDVMALDAGRGGFRPKSLDAVLAERLASLDVHPSGPLWGRGDPPTGGAAGELESALAAEFPALCRGLEAQGLVQERRALRMKVEGLAAVPAGEGKIVVEFSLARGGYATSVLRELFAIEQGSAGRNLSDGAVSDDE